MNMFFYVDFILPKRGCVKTKVLANLNCKPNTEWQYIYRFDLVSS